MATLCLELKADANGINSEGEPPLTLAALCGHAYDGTINHHWQSQSKSCVMY
jgi:hypothetical protein